MDGVTGNSNASIKLIDYYGKCTSHSTLALNDSNEMPGKNSMVMVVIYLIGWAVLVGCLWSTYAIGLLPSWIVSFSLAYQCALMGAVGGIVYCLRAVYLNRSVRDTWDPKWTTWYILRPIVSSIVGFVAFIFLNAGLLVLDAEHNASPNNYGFLALSFVAGLNVDRFLVKIEDIARTAWGIRPSRASEESEQVSPNSSERQNQKESE